MNTNIDDMINHLKNKIKLCDDKLKEGEKNNNIDEKLIFKIKNGGTIEEIKDLIDKGANLKFKDRYGDTPLLGLGYDFITEGTKGREKEILKILLEAGADVYETNKRGNNIFTICMYGSNVEVVEVFEILLNRKYEESFIDELVYHCKKEKETWFFSNTKTHDKILKLLEEYKEKNFNLLKN